jgi:hypothetical protein
MFEYAASNAVRQVSNMSILFCCFQGTGPIEKLGECHCPVVSSSTDADKLFQDLNDGWRSQLDGYKAYVYFGDNMRLELKAWLSVIKATPAPTDEADFERYAETIGASSVAWAGGNVHLKCEVRHVEAATLSFACGYTSLQPDC